MKVRLWRSAPIWGLVCVVGCGGGSLTDEEAKKFHDIVARGDLPKVKEMVQNDRRYLTVRNGRSFAAPAPLHSAAGAGQKEVVEFFLAEGADVDVVLYDTYGAKHSGLGTTPLWCAAAWGHRDVVEALLSRGAQIEARNYKWETPLFVAAVAGHTEVVRLLLERGADPCTKNSMGHSPLILAKQKGFLEVAQLLEARGGE